MANTMTAVIPQIFANQAAISLRKNLVWPRLFLRADKNNIANLDNGGKTVSIIVPPTLSAALYTSGDLTVPDITQSTVDVTMNKHGYVAFHLTDQELTQIIKNPNLAAMYMGEAMYALADQIDAYAATFAAQCKYFVNKPGTAIDADDIVDARVILNQNKAPKQDRYLVLDAANEGSLLKVEKLTTIQNVGEKEEAIIPGSFGRRYGFDIYENGNVETQTPTDLAGAINNGAGYPAGTTTITVDGFSAAPPEGAMFTISGETSTPQHTVVGTATTTSITFYPALTEAVADDDTVTFVANINNFAFNKNYAALAIRPLTSVIDLAGLRGEGQVAYQEFDGVAVRVELSRQHLKGWYWLVSVDTEYGCSQLYEECGCRIIN